jgi:hypothetical protein
MKGILSLYQNGKLVARKQNQIHQDLPDYLVQRFNSDTDLSLRSLFTSYGIIDDRVGQDGIILFDTFLSGWYALPTSVVSSDQTGQARFQGLIIPETSITVQNFQIGHGALATGDDRFSTMYATGSLDSETEFFENVPLVVIWDITVGTDEE